MNPEQRDEQQPSEWRQPEPTLPQAPFETVSQEEETPAATGYPTAAPDEDMVHDDSAEDVQLENSNDDTPLLNWQGTEYIQHDRGMGWYIGLVVVTLILMMMAILVLHSVTFSLLIPVMAVALVVYVRRPAVTLNYIVSRKGLHINDKLFTYDQFKSFGVITHAGSHAIVLTPRKRFQIGQTIYFPEQLGEQLVDMMAARLPMKEVEPDVVDRFLARIRL